MKLEPIGGAELDLNVRYVAKSLWLILDRIDNIIIGGFMVDLLLEIASSFVGFVLVSGLLIVILTSITVIGIFVYEGVKYISANSGRE